MGMMMWTELWKYGLLLVVWDTLRLMQNRLARRNLTWNKWDEQLMNGFVGEFQRMKTLEKSSEMDEPFNEIPLAQLVTDPHLR